MSGIRGKTIFITGGAGFIASHLIEALVEDNAVTIYDNLHRNAFQYTGFVKHPHVRFIQGDVLDEELLTRSMSGADICVHAAAIAGIYSINKSASHTMKVNLLGTYHALEAARKNQVKRFIDFSTSEVYGPFVYKGKETDMTTLGPVGAKRWVYAVSKLAGEHFAHTYAEDSSFEVVTVRPFNIYGPRQVGEGAVQQILIRALRNEDIVVYNDGTQIRSWCYVKDFIEGLCKAMVLEEARNQTFNLGNPQATVTVLGLVQTILRMTRSGSKVVHKPHPGPEVEMRIPDISNAEQRLGFKPKVGMEEGLAACIDWYREHLEDVK